MGEDCASWQGWQARGCRPWKDPGGTRIRLANVTSSVMRAGSWGTWRLMHGLGPASASVLPIIVSWCDGACSVERCLCNPCDGLAVGIYSFNSCFIVCCGSVFALSRRAESCRVQGVRRDDFRPAPARDTTREMRKVGTTLAQRSPLERKKWQVRKGMSELTGRLPHYLHYIR